MGNRGTATPCQAPPSILATPFARTNCRDRMQLLSEEEQTSIINISQVVEFPRGKLIYSEGSRSNYVYNIVAGAAKTYWLLPSGQRRISSFLFPSDLLGLSENGQYVATAQALMSVTAYKIPWDAFEEMVRRDPKLDVALLCKLCHELRQAERHTIQATHLEASTRLASFILWLWRSEGQSRNANEVALPMLRHDIADYLGLTPESVSRALLQLEIRGLVKRQGPKALELLDIVGLQSVSGEG